MCGQALFLKVRVVRPHTPELGRSAAPSTVDQMRASSAASLLIGAGILTSTTAACQSRPPEPSPSANLSTHVPTQLAPLVACCPGAEATLFPVAALQQRDGWYGKQLRAAGEGPLCAFSDQAAETYRFSWIPSFSPTVVVRVSMTDTAVFVTAKRLNGAGGYEPGSLVVNRTVRVPPDAALRLRALIDSTGLWQATPPTDERVGLDGAQWIIEGVRGGRYHAIDWWSPQESGSGRHMRRLGVYLFSLADLLPRDPAAVY